MNPVAPHYSPGARFGRLTILERQATYVLCRCDCGNQTTVRGLNLKYGFTQSCGCLRARMHLTYQGETLPLARWAEIINLSRPTLRKRIKHGWDVERALNTPARAPNHSAQ